MAWFSGKVKLGHLSEAVNKLSASVKNIEKNFDTALGIEGEGSVLTDKNVVFDPILGYVGPSTIESSEVSSSTKTASTEKQRGKDGVGAVESSEKLDSLKHEDDSRKRESENLVGQASEQLPQGQEVNEEVRHVEMEAGSEEKIKNLSEEANNNATADHPEAEVIDGGREEKKEDTSEKPKDDPTVDHSDAEVMERGFEEERKDAVGEQNYGAIADHAQDVAVSPSIPVEASEQKLEKDDQRKSVGKETPEQNFRYLELVQPESVQNFESEGRSEEVFPALAQSVPTELTGPVHNVEDLATISTIDDDATSYLEDVDGKHADEEDMNKIIPAQAQDASKEPAESRESSASDIPGGLRDSVTVDKSATQQNSQTDALKAASHLVTSLNEAVVKHLEKDDNVNEKLSRIGGNPPDVVDSMDELEKVKKEMKMMETALHGAARQAQAKADEIARLMSENEKLEAVIKDLRRKTNEENETLREEYHQRVSTLERKMYALTRERDTLRREQNKKSDAAALLKEKDEIITQVMAEGESLSKKQAAQESQIRKLRAQVREFEEEKKGLLSKIQIEENKVESIKRDKTATEKLLQETIDKHQVELAGQKEYYMKALDAAKEAEAIVQARANSEARTELERRLRETEDRESLLVQTLEELRQTLSRTEQQAVFREDMLRRDIEDLQKRYQASERRCEELVTQVPESTRPLLRQIESMQETASRRAEGWAAVERNLNSRLQEAEAKAAASEEKERSTSERLTQTLSRMNVLEAQISCLRAEQTQLTRSLEKERQRAAENRQEYLALKEVADTHESRSEQLEEEIREIRAKHKQEVHEIRAHQELLQQELEREKTARFDQEKPSHLSTAMPDPSPREKPKSDPYENGNLPCRISSASSLNSVEESTLLQSTLDSPGRISENRIFGEGSLSPYYMRSVTSSTFEATLRQKEGELASYASRLASMESIRDSLAEELVKLTAECEKLRSEAAALPGIKAELDALRRRHSAALELMGERDEELEELRADIVDLKEMYREQVSLLVNKIQKLSSSITAA